MENSKGQADGIATLDTTGKVPTIQLPSMNYIPTSEKGVANGVATLDSNGNVPLSMLGNVDNGASVAKGNYTGNGFSKNISLGFTPKYVWIFDTSQSASSSVLVFDSNTCLLLRSYNGFEFVFPMSSKVYINSNGFTMNDDDANKDGHYYYYIAVA